MGELLNKQNHSIIHVQCKYLMQLPVISSHSNFCREAETQKFKNCTNWPYYKTEMKEKWACHALNVVLILFFLTKLYH